jgi:RNA polymerase primary sigma factor
MKTTIQKPMTVTSTTVVRSKHPVTVLHYTKLPSPAPPAAGQRAGPTQGSATTGGPRPRAFEFMEAHDPDIVFRLYAREIGQVNLLTPAEEVVLARRIKKGDAAAREQMIKANLRLVVKIAHDFEGFGLPLLDLISEGNIGLMKAVERFDPARGAKLSTYAAFYIKQAMRRAIADLSRLIRLPVYAQEKLLMIHRAESKLREEFGRAPLDEEISAEIGLPAVKVRKLRAAAVQPLSLDAPLDGDPSNPVAEVVPDENARTPDEKLGQDDTTQLMLELMSNLPPRELQIIRHRFGFEEGREKTLEEIGADLGLTRERIRQLQNSALRRLRTRIEAREAIRLAA